MALYSKVGYWDHRYRNNESPYEWYQGYQSLRHLLNPLHFASQSSFSENSALPHPRGSIIDAGGGSGSVVSGDSASAMSNTPAVAGEGAVLPPSTVRCMFPPRDRCRTLILGCGNSTLGEDMQRDGWTGRIVNVDYSSVVIEQMRAKYSPSFYQQNAITTNVPLEWLHADITQPLPFDKDSFDLIVCKGSFDAVLCGAGSRFNIRRVVQECVRILTPGTGIFFLVTHGNPDSRIEYLEYENELYHYWSSVQVHTVSRFLPPTQHQTSFPGNHLPQPHHSFGAPHHSHTFPLPPSRTDYVYICRKRPSDQTRPDQVTAENIRGLTSTSLPSATARNLISNMASLKMTPSNPH